MTHFEAYLLTRLDYFARLFGVITFISAFTSILIFIVILIALSNSSDDKYNERYVKFFKYSFLTLIFGALSMCLIPTTKEAAFIYIAPAIVNNKDIQKTVKQIPELSGLGLEYLGGILKNEIKEVKKEVKETIKK